MQYRTLGQSDIKISVIALGTMTYGGQNSEAEAHQQLDYAFQAGVNFIDTAELYAIPPSEKTYGRSEEYIGSWLKKSANRNNIILATKVTGPASNWLPYIRHGKTCLNRKNLEIALNDSLKRLQTDYIDLYQLHWPDRKTNIFGQLGYTHDLHNQSVPIEETLQALNDLVNAGKIRYVGISNETPWGVMRFLQVAEQLQLPRIATIQNPYSLLNRSFEMGLAEMAIREQIGLLAYSPLGFGVLTGKYLHGESPPNSRLTLYTQYARYCSSAAKKATQAYVEIAQQHNLDPAQMALAFIHRQPFLCSTIIGATTMEQLRCNIASIELSLSNQVLEKIKAIHQTYPNPSP